MNRGDDVAVSKVGSALRRIVQERPGIHFRALERAAGLSSAGHLRHHLDRLERKGLVVEVEDGHYKRFFAAGAHDARLRPELARFARPVPRLIGMVLLSRPMTRTGLRRRLGCADSTLGYHLRRMVQQGDLLRTPGDNCCLYSLVDPVRVQHVLRIHDAGLHAPDAPGVLGTAAARRPGPAAAPTPSPPPGPEPQPAIPTPPTTPPPAPPWTSPFEEPFPWPAESLEAIRPSGNADDGARGPSAAVDPPRDETKPPTPAYESADDYERGESSEPAPA